jgi:serine/threonine protein kinase
MKIVELFVNGFSLREVLLMNPKWWTPTMKTKTVAGIVLGLRFIHSFGLIHGNLNSNNIQITNFGQMDLEFERGECVIGSDVFDERWTRNVDVCGFLSILLEIIIGHPGALPSDVNSEKAGNQHIR